jgi:O-Antigen ligase
MADEASSSSARLTANGARARGSKSAVTTRSLASAAFAIPPLALLAVAGLLAVRGGGTVPEDWAPVAVGTAIALAVLGAVGSLPAIPRSAWPALGALAGFFAWSALSVIWSSSPETTVEAVARFALLILAVVIGASYGARPSGARAIAVGLAVAGAALAITVEAKILWGTTGMFSTRRLAWPIDYSNGAAALLWLPAPALLAGAASERIRPLGRAALAGLAALALSEGLMTLSRGGSVALAGTLVVCVLVATQRARFALVLVGIAVPVLVAVPRLTAGRPGELASDAMARGRAAALSATAAAVIVGAIAFLERARRSEFQRHAGVVAAGVWTCLAILGAAAFAIHSGRPDSWLSARWHEFENPALTRPADAARFGNATSNRRDYWRVAARTLESHPVRGEGAGAFAVPWFRRRAIDESVTDAHSWEASALAETGVVGFLLLAAAMVLPLVRLARARHEMRTFTAVALGGTASYFVLHASVDWLFRIPAIAVAGFLVLGVCSAAPTTGGIRLAPRGQRIAVALGALVAVVAAVPVYLSTTLTARAETQAAESTQRALDSLSLATDVNPWAVHPLIVRSTILLDDGRTDGAIRAARDATQRGPNDWTAWIALADAQRAGGHHAASAVAIRRARLLNPKALEKTAGSVP